MADNIFTKFSTLINASLDSRINALQKSEAPEDLSKGEKKDGTIGRRGLSFDPFMDNNNSQGIYKLKVGFISNPTLKHVARANTVVSSIIELKASQVATACKRPSSRFDLGFRLIPKDKTIEADPEEIRKAEEFLLNTGYTADRKSEDKMTLDQWGSIITKDFLRFGHAAIEKVKRADGTLYEFPPLSAETIYYADKEAKQQTLQQFRDVWEASHKVNDGDIEANKQVGSTPVKYVQVINGNVTEGFTEDELVFARYNLSSDIDLNGYCIGPLEKAIGAITSHMQVENHQKQFFNHGTASKGVMVIQGDVSPQTLKTLQAQWNNQISGPLNAWRTPILAGIKGANWIPLTASNRDMEFAAWQDYVLRVVFGAFGVDPEEVGFGYLSKGTEQRSMSESSNEWKITASRDRSLRPILGRIEAIINEDILPEYSIEFSKKYHFVFVGLDAETEMEETARLQQETSLLVSLDEARKQTEREELEYGGKLILNPLLLQTLQMNLPKGVFMETFIGVEGASERPDLAYVPDPLWFQYQQMQMGMMGVGQPQGGGQPGGSPQQEDPQQQQASGQEMSQEDQEAQAEQAQQQQDAINAYMEANPELFKSLKRNLGKYEDMKKSERAAKKINQDIVDDFSSDLSKDFKKAGDMLIKEILEAVKDDLKDKK